MVTTLHGRLDLPEFFPIYDAFRPSTSSRSATRSASRCRSSTGWRRSTTACPWTSTRSARGRATTCSFLGRISPEKRPHAAIDIARKLGIRLVIAAKVDAADRAYYEEAIVPRLERGSGVDFVGETDLPETIRLLGDARALLFPIDWPEPFGLAMIEAMACGTPVVTRRCGSTPELIDHGKTGFVCDDDDEIALALRKLDRLDRAVCREAAATRFSVERMADDYEAVYRRLVRERMSRWTTSSAFTIDTTSSPPQGSRTTALES